MRFLIDILISISLSGKKVALIEDVVSSGGEIVDALTKLNTDDIVPVAVVCVVDRQSGGAETLAGLGIKLASVFTMGDILEET